MVWEFYVCLLVLVYINYVTTEKQYVKQTDLCCFDYHMGNIQTVLW